MWQDAPRQRALIGLLVRQRRYGPHVSERRFQQSTIGPRGMTSFVDSGEQFTRENRVYIPPLSSRRVAHAARVTA